MEHALDNLDGLTAHQVTMEIGEHRGAAALRVRKLKEVTAPDEPTFVMLDGPAFQDGAIDVEVAGDVLPDAEGGARGFIGVAFRIAPDRSRFESMYIRPTNGRAEVQLRRNRAAQYFSYPDYKFDRLRAEAAGEYEAYVDLVPAEWTPLRVVVSGGTAKLYVHGAGQPTLWINDLKLGGDASGAVGLYVDNGTDGFFRSLKVTPA